MSVQSGKGDSIRRYLLGELSEQEREQVEQRLMSDDELYRQLRLAEDDLIDEYISGSLPEQERAEFSRRFLSVPELRQDVRFTRALRKHARETAPPAAAADPPPRASLSDRLRAFFMHPALGASLAAALLAAVVLAAWLAARNSQLSRQVEQLQARQTPPPSAEAALQEQLAAERLRNEQLSAELLRQQELLAEESRKLQLAQGRTQPTPARSPPPPGGAVAFVALSLTPGAVRDAGALGALKKISVTPATREVRVRLDLPEAGYRAYRAVLETVDGREVWSRQGLRAGREKSVPLSIPARLLRPDDYQIILSGVTPSGETEEIASYYFRVFN